MSDLHITTQRMVENKRREIQGKQVVFKKLRNATQQVTHCHIELHKTLNLCPIGMVTWICVHPLFIKSSLFWLLSSLMCAQCCKGLSSYQILSSNFGSVSLCLLRKNNTRRQSTIHIRSPYLGLYILNCTWWILNPHWILMHCKNFIYIKEKLQIHLERILNVLCWEEIKEYLLFIGILVIFLPIHCFHLHLSCVKCVYLYSNCNVYL